MNAFKRLLGLATAGLFLAACSAPPRAVNYPEANVRVDVAVAGIDLGSGSGWYIASNADFGILVTAGHVCEEAFTFSLSDGGLAFQMGYDHDEAPIDDVCLLVTLPAPGRVLQLAAQPATAGTRVEYYGYPVGVRAHYHGEVSAVDEDGVLTLSMPTYFGSSGSAVTANGRVVGLVSMGYSGFGVLGYATGLESLKAAKVAADAWLAAVDSFQDAGVDDASE